jgi:hypothetical protein
LKRDATIIVTGAVELRSPTPAAVVLAVDGRSVGLPVRVRGDNRWNTYPLINSFDAVGGEHSVRLMIPPGVEAGAASLSVSAVAASSPERRRSAGRH